MINTNEAEKVGNRVVYFNRLEPGSLYFIQIREQNMSGWGEWSVVTPLLTNPFRMSFRDNESCTLSDDGFTVINDTNQSYVVQLGYGIAIRKRPKECKVQTHKMAKKGRHYLNGRIVEWKLKFQHHHENKKNSQNQTNVTLPSQFAIGWSLKTHLPLIQSSITAMRSGQYTKPYNLPLDLKCGFILDNGSLWNDFVWAEGRGPNNPLWKVNDTVLVRLNTIKKHLQCSASQRWFLDPVVKHMEIGSDDFVLFVWLSQDTKITILDQKVETP